MAINQVPSDNDSKIISTVNNDQQTILRNIEHLYTGRFDLDCTYSQGKFYEGCIGPKHTSDIVFGCGKIQADVRALPFRSASFNSIVFDPPFIHAHGKDSIVGNRFSSYRTQHDIRALYMNALVEIWRCLKTRGVLVFKCQDIIESGKQVMNHCHIWQMAHSLGFTDLDLFILTSSSRLIGHNQHEQQHARKFHSYFWVFKK